MLTVASTGFSMHDLLPRQETESLPLTERSARAQTTATGIVTRWASLLSSQNALCRRSGCQGEKVVPFGTLKGHRDDERFSGVDAAPTYVPSSPFTFSVSPLHRLCMSLSTRLMYGYSSVITRGIFSVIFSVFFQFQTLHTCLISFCIYTYNNVPNRSNSN